MYDLKIDGTSIWNLIEKGGVKRIPRKVYGQNGGDTLDGTHHLDVLAEKTDFEITCRPMSESEFGGLIDALSGTYFPSLSAIRSETARKSAIAKASRQRR